MRERRWRGDEFGKNRNVYIRGRLRDGGLLKCVGVVLKFWT